MPTWGIALAIVGAGLVILVLAALPLLRRLRALERAMGRARAAHRRAATVQASVADLGGRLAVLEEQARAVTGRLPTRVAREGFRRTPREVEPG